MTSHRATRACPQALATAYDVALLDLDGVVYVGQGAVPNAADALARARALGMRLAFVTNNASRSPETVAAHLTSLGVPASAPEVVTSAQAAARVVAELVPAESPVLVVGGVGLVDALAEAGLRPVFSVDDDPVAVVQGYDPELSWRELAEGAFALAKGVPWVASNTDLTLPTPRGVAPGNGAFVEVLRLTTGREPEVAGKPETPMHREAVVRSGARRPLVVGDRLDTDIDGANRAGADSLLVLTGITGTLDLVRASPQHRPTYVAADLRGLLTPHPEVLFPSEGIAKCGRWTAQFRGSVPGLTRDGDAASSSPGGRVLAGDDDRIDALRALAAVVWDRFPDGVPDIPGLAETWAGIYGPGDMARPRAQPNAG